MAVFGEGNIVGQANSLIFVLAIVDAGSGMGSSMADAVRNGRVAFTPVVPGDDRTMKN